MRIALVCDFLEERWPSMDLVAEMLYQHIPPETHGSFDLVRPRWRQYLTRLPLIGDTKLLRNGERLMNRTLVYSRHLRSIQHSFQGFHILDHSYAHLALSLPAGQTVVTCHDLDAFRCLLEPAKDPRPLWFCKMAERILAGLRRAAHVICVSDAVRADIARFNLLPAERTTVIHWGPHPSCKLSPDPVSDVKADQLLGSLPRGAVRLLNVGSTIPRKRMDVLLRVLASLRRESPDFHLIRVGGAFTPEQQALARELKLNEAITIMPFLDRDVLSAIYRKSNLLLQTSEAEGFGLPIVEAMACGLPVVATDLPVLREVGGSSAVFCELNNIEGWTTSILSLIKEERDLPGAWQDRRVSAAARAAMFSWQRTSQETLSVYRRTFQPANP